MEPTTSPPEPGPLRRLVRLAIVDTGPLRRHREFRLLFVGQSVTFFGSMVRSVAVPYQVYQLTHSSLAVGGLGVVALVVILGFAFLGGALADSVDRRRMVLLTEGGIMVTSAVLAINALLPVPQLWLLYAMEAVGVAIDSLQRPSLDALLPRLVDRDELKPAGALRSLTMNGGMVAGPALGGVLIAAIGLALTYAVDVLSFVVSLIALAMMRAVPPPADAERPSVRRVVEGLRYARSRPELMGTYLVDMVAMFFGLPEALFPALASVYGGAGVLGFIYAAPAVGSLIASATSGWTRHVHRHGMAVIMAALCWGLAIVAFGAIHWLPLALLCLAAAGGADMVSGLFRGAIWNETIPDELRGRLASIELVSYSSGPALSGIESGVAAALFGLRASVISGGALCVAGVAVLAVALPRFRQYDSRHGVPAMPVVAGHLAEAE